MNGANAETAYDLLEDRIALYKYRPGMRLSPDQLSNDIRIGLTPTRTALQWLHRDGIIAHQHGQGYYVKTPSIEECTELYRGNKIQLVGAIDLSNAPVVNSRKDDGTHDSQVSTAQDLGQTANGQALNNSTALLFTEIASLAESDIVVRAVQTINSRLRFIRVIEADIIEGVDHELNDMHSLMRDKNYNELRNHVGVYHDKRLAAVNDIIDASFARAFRQ
jgi:DNA-binding GntR family transcriptional regulator